MNYIYSQYLYLISFNFNLIFKSAPQTLVRMVELVLDL